MAETDTAAVLEPVTAEEVPDTEAVLADTATDLPDTEVEESPDTEVEQPRGISEEEIATRIKAERDRWESDLRTTYEEQVRTQAAQERRTRAQELRTGTTAQQLQSIVAWAYKQGEEGHDFRFDPRSVGQLAQNMEAAVFQDQSDAWAGAFSAYLGQQFKDFRPSQQTAHRLASGFRDWNPAQVVEAQFEAMKEAVRADMETKLRPELEKSIRAELGAAGKTAALKQNDAARAGQPKPTGAGIAGAAAPRRSLSDIIADPDTSQADRIKAFQKLHGIAAPGH